MLLVVGFLQVLVNISYVICGTPSESGVTEYLENLLIALRKTI